MKKLILLLLLIPNVVMAETTLRDVLVTTLEHLLSLLKSIIDAFQKLTSGDILDLTIFQAVFLVIIFLWILDYISNLLDSVGKKTEVFFEAVGLTKLLVFLFGKIRAVTKVVTKKCYEFYNFPASWLIKKAQKYDDCWFFIILNILIFSFLFVYYILTFILFIGLLIFLAAYFFYLLDYLFSS